MADGFDPDDSRDDCYFKAVIRFAQKLFHSLSIEPAGNLLRGSDSEIVARDLSKAAALNFIFEGFALGLGAFQDCVGVAERICERTV
ncbi:MAG: hypothetical protein WBD90_17460 [Xanthobacteraceae bacterium]